MVVHLVRRLRALMLLITVSVVFGSASFAHRAPVSQDLSRDAFLASGFTLSDLCGTLNGSEHPEPCLACTLAANAVLPPNDPMVRDAHLVFVRAISAPRASQSVTVVHDPARATRGPPLA